MNDGLTEILYKELQAFGIDPRYEDAEALAQTIAGQFNVINKKVNRLEIIDHTKSNPNFGRAFVKWVKSDFLVETSLQDSEKTLKIFLSDIGEK